MCLSWRPTTGTIWRALALCPCTVGTPGLKEEDELGGHVQITPAQPSLPGCTSELPVELEKKHRHPGPLSQTLSGVGPRKLHFSMVFREPGCTVREDLRHDREGGLEHPQGSRRASRAAWSGSCLPATHQNRWGRFKVPPRLGCTPDQGNQTWAEGEETSGSCPALRLLIPTCTQGGELLRAAVLQVRCGNQWHHLETCQKRTIWGHAQKLWG